MSTSTSSNGILQQSFVTRSSGSDHVYVNLSLTNNTQAPIPATVFTVRTDSVLDNCSEYYVSIIRFTVPTSNIPILIFEPNFYSVSLTYQAGGMGPVTTAQAFLQNNAPDNLTPQFMNYIFSYQYICDMINEAYYQAFITLFPTYLTNGAGVPANTNPPYMIFEPETQLFSLISDSTYQFLNPSVLPPYPAPGASAPQQNPLWNGLRVYMNYNLYGLFDNLYSQTLGYGLANGLDVLITIDAKYNTPTSPPLPFPAGANSNIIKMQQQYVNTAALYSPRSIQFVTNNIPVQTEVIPGSNSSSRQILTDFEFNISEGQLGNSIRGYVQYAATKYRFTDLKTETALKILDLTVYWTDEVENINQLFIPPNETMTVKLLFRKKYDGKYI